MLLSSVATFLDAMQAKSRFEIPFWRSVHHTSLECVDPSKHRRTVPVNFTVLEIISKFLIFWDVLGGLRSFVMDQLFEKLKL